MDNKKYWVKIGVDGKTGWVLFRDENMETITGAELRANIKSIIDDMNMGNISIIEAKEKAEPYIQEINNRGKFIAKEFRKRFYPITFYSIAR